MVADTFDVTKLQLGTHATQHNRLQLRTVTYSGSDEQLLIETPALLLDSMVYYEGPSGPNDFQTHILIRCLLPQPNRRFEAVFRTVENSIPLPTDYHIKCTQDPLDGRFNFMAGVNKDGVQWKINRQGTEVEIGDIQIHCPIKLLIRLEHLQMNTETKESVLVWSVLEMTVLQ